MLFRDKKWTFVEFQVWVQRGAGGFKVALHPLLMVRETKSLGRSFSCSDSSTIENESVNRSTVLGRSRNRFDDLMSANGESTQSSIKLEGRFLRFFSHKRLPERYSECNNGSISFMFTFCWLRSINTSSQARWRRFKVLGRRLSSSVGHSDVPMSIHHSTSCIPPNVVKYQRGQGIQDVQVQQSEVLFKPPFFNL